MYYCVLNSCARLCIYIYIKYVDSDKDVRVLSGVWWSVWYKTQRLHWWCGAGDYPEERRPRDSFHIAQHNVSHRHTYPHQTRWWVCHAGQCVYVSVFVLAMRNFLFKIQYRLCGSSGDQFSSVRSDAKLRTRQWNFASSTSRVKHVLSTRFAQVCTVLCVVSVWTYCKSRSLIGTVLIAVRVVRPFNRSESVDQWTVFFRGISFWSAASKESHTATPRPVSESWEHTPLSSLQILVSWHFTGLIHT